MENESLSQPTADLQRLDTAYFNGFHVTIGSGDVVIVLLRNGEPFTMLQASYTVAKTLAQALGTTMSLLEELTGNQIMTTHFIEDKMKAAKAIVKAPEDTQNG